MIHRRACIVALALLASGLHSRQSRADIIMGTGSGQNLYEYNTTTMATNVVGLTGTPGAYSSDTLSGITYGPNGNLYIAMAMATVTGSAGSGAILEYSTSGAYVSTFQPAGLMGTGFNTIGLTFDSAGNLFATTSSNNGSTPGIVEYEAGGGTQFLPSLTPASSEPYKVAVSSTGILYSTDLFNGNITEYNLNSSTPTTPTLFATLGVGAYGIAVDSSGNVFVTSDGVGTYEYNSSGGTPIGNPLSAAGGYRGALAYDAGLSTLFAVTAPNLYSIDPSNTNSSTNYTVDSSGFNGSEFITVVPSVVPEPSSFVLGLTSAVGIAIVAWARRRRSTRG